MYTVSYTHLNGYCSPVDVLYRADSELKRRRTCFRILFIQRYYGRTQKDVYKRQTYNRAYNDFSQFIAANPSVEKMVANAEEAGYKLLDRADLYSSEDVYKRQV